MMETDRKNEEKIKENEEEEVTEKKKRIECPELFLKKGELLLGVFKKKWIFLAWIITLKTMFALLPRKKSKKKQQFKQKGGVYR